MTAPFVHPKAAERATCPRIDGHYVPNRCRVVYLALRAQPAGHEASYDNLVVDNLEHTRHERKLRELREINREYDAAGRVIWDLVLTRKARGAPHNLFLLNREPRQVAGQQAIPYLLTHTPAAPVVARVDAGGRLMGTVEADILTLMGG